MSQTVTFINFNQINTKTSSTNNQETVAPSISNNESIFDSSLSNDTTNTAMALGETSNEKSITQSLWGTEGSVVTQSLSETGEGLVITQSLSETGEGAVVTQSLGETGGEVKYTEVETKYLDSILNKDGKIGWSEYMAFMELADKDGDGELTEAEKQAAFASLKSDSSKVTELKNKVKSVGSSNKELVDIDKNYGTNDDLKVQTDEFSNQFGSDIAKLVDINGNGQISRLEYQAFVEMVDQDGDGKLLDKELQTAKKEWSVVYGNSSSSTSSTSGTSSNSIKDQLKAIYNKLAKYSRKYVPMLSGQFNTDTSSTTPTSTDSTSTSTSDSTSSSSTSTSTSESTSSSSTSASSSESTSNETNSATTKTNETDILDKLLDNDGKYSKLEHQAFIRYADKNNDGIISEVEKEAAMTALQNSSEAAKLKAEYDKIKLSDTELKSLDKNADGKVSKEEFAAKYGKDIAEAMNLVLKTDGNIDIDEMLVLMKYADANGDGKLDSDEIKAASTKLNNTDRNSKRSERLKLKNIYWQDVSIRNKSYDYMT